MALVMQQEKTRLYRLFIESTTAAAATDSAAKRAHHIIKLMSRKLNHKFKDLPIYFFTIEDYIVEHAAAVSIHHAVLRMCVLEGL